MSVFKHLKEMHDKYGFKRKCKPSLLPMDYMDFRLGFLDEELAETKLAYDKGDLPEVIDGLIDLMVVAAGTLDLMGVNAQAHWNEVHRANMNKRVVNNPNTSKRGFAFDLEKPFNWIPPNHQKILDQEVGKELIGENRIVYLEGPDGAGKTTFIQNHMKDGDIVIHNGPYDTREEAYDSFLDQYSAAELALSNNPNITVFIDRGPISELIYGHVLREQSMEPTDRFFECLRTLRRLNASVVLCMPPYSTANANWKSRLNEELVQDDLKYTRIYLKYKVIEQLLKESRLDFDIYNYEERG